MGKAGVQLFIKCKSSVLYCVKDGDGGGNDADASTPPGIDVAKLRHGLAELLETQRAALGPATKPRGANRFAPYAGGGATPKPQG